MEKKQLDIYLKRLEFNTVLERIAALTVNNEARDKILETVPCTNAIDADKLLGFTDCLMDLVVRGRQPGISSQDSLPMVALRAEKGGILSMAELITVRRALQNARVLREWYQPTQDKAWYADEYFSALFEDYHFERELGDSILSDTEMSDSASPALADIRRKIQNAESSIRDKLDTIIHSTSSSKYLQESIVTMRGGRFVVPVKTENRNAVQGLVHDVSSSGSTVFIEPIAVVEANNRIMQLKADEQQEIERILSVFSGKVQNMSSALIRSHKAVIAIDVAAAKAKYALSLDALRPDINEEGIIELRKARHPLIDKQKVVPIDVLIGKNYTSLIITGPNTGGKTVSIKTTGLMCVMAACGIPVPASAGSNVCIFENVLADIGDEQSIEQSLSTFSSHIKNIKEILAVAGGRSLVLLDELGAGTDPAEGAALAEAILERLRQMGCRVMATTHYGEIKLYAMQTEGVQNASCEFDVNTLSPTYRLNIGVPGRSNALLICERLGLDKDLLDDARYGMSVEDRRFEEAIAEVDQLKSELAAQQSEIDKLKEDAKAEVKKAKDEAEKIRKQAEKEMEAAKNRAKQLSADVTSGAYKLMDELKKLEADDEKSRKEKIQRAKQIANNESQKLTDFEDTGTLLAGDALPKLTSVTRGQEVYVTSLGRTATAMGPADKNGYVELQSGMLKTKAKLSDLRKAPENVKHEVKKTYNVSRGIAKDDGKSKTEIDIRGMMVDEAILELERFVDTASMSHIHILYIIHGKGTGALRSGVQQWLKRCPQVKSFRLGQYGEGDAGVTVAELK